MKNSPSQISNHLINKFDLELMMLIKNDLEEQSIKIKNKLIHLITIKFDNELYQIIKQDILLIKEQLNNHQIKLAQAG